MYTYKARLNRVIDGDTVDLMVDLGFNVAIKIRVRLARIDTPKANTPEGKISTQFVKDLFENSDYDCHLVSRKKGKWGRWIGEIEVDKGNISDLLLDAMLAEKWG